MDRGSLMDTLHLSRTSTRERRLIKERRFTDLLRERRGFKYF